MPASIGYQDLAALIAQQPAVTERWRQHIRTSTFGTIHAATFSFPRPMGASIPDPYFTQLASLDPRALDVTGSVSLQAPIETVMKRPQYDFPEVDRSRKGDRLTVNRPPAAPVPVQPKPAVSGKKDQASLTEGVKSQETKSQESKYQESKYPESKPQESKPAKPTESTPTSQPSAPQSLGARKGDRAVPTATTDADVALERAAIAATSIGQIRFAAPLPRANVSLTESAASTAAAAVAAKKISDLSSQVAEAAPEISTETADLESSRADVYGPIAIAVAKAPAPEPAQASAPAASSPPDGKASTGNGDSVVDSLVKFTQPEKQTTLFFGTHAIGFGQGDLQPWGADEVPTVLAAPHVDPEIKRAALDSVPDEVVKIEDGGESVAPKGEVTGEGARPRTPAERLNLSGVSRVKHEKCLANAIYFEARGEVERGQMAVAQVVLNRAFSGYYPGNVCDVVYQNAHRHLACQFTFACDNHRDVVNDQKAWGVATRIASEALDGKFWLPEVGKATHYHATYVNPWWVRTMTKHTKLGIHVFYRPRRWGEGEEIPVWGDRLDVTGTITPLVGSADDKHTEAQPVARRSIFDPVEEIKPGG